MDNIDYAAMGERVRQARRLLDMTHGELAKKVDASTPFIGHIERGEKKASAETIVALSCALEASTDWLLMGRDNHCDWQRCGLFEDFKALVQRYGEIDQGKMRDGVLTENT